MKITQCGGMRVPTISECDIILVDRGQNQDGVDEYVALRKRHAIDPNVRVRLPSWIDECLVARELVLDPKPVRRLPGVALGSRWAYSCTTSITAHISTQGGRRFLRFTMNI